MRLLRHLLLAVAVAVGVFAAGIGAAPADARTEGLGAPGTAQGSDGTAADVVDHELLQALERSGQLEHWYASSPHGRLASTMFVDGGQEHDRARAGVLELAESVAAGRADDLALIDAIDRAQAGVETLDRLARLLRQRAITGAEETTELEATLIRKALHQVAAAGGHDGLLRTLAALERLREDLGFHVEAQRRSDRSKADDAGPLSVVLDELERLDRELERMRTRAEAMSLDQQLLLAELAAAIGELHQLRVDARSMVESLPLVTLDAYARAGDHGIDGCGVDWTLLAGIGRIESLHGTLGDAWVHADGTVGPERIFGPLLDGGATRREAAEAAAAAEAEAARLQAEAEAEAARIAEEEAARERVLFGLPEPEEDGDGETAPGEDQLDEETARLRALYGDHAVPPVVDEESDDHVDDALPGDDEGIDPAAFDNGFAVIRDSDDGALDGNARWDRAVGPMQFLPETWSLYGRDGNGDGVLDPHNLYDAAAGAAAYLCHLERRNGPSPWVYVLGYNNSDAYVAAVMDVAGRFGAYGLGD